MLLLYGLVSFSFEAVPWLAEELKHCEDGHDFNQEKGEQVNGVSSLNDCRANHYHAKLEENDSNDRKDDEVLPNRALRLEA